MFVRLGLWLLFVLLLLFANGFEDGGPPVDTVTANTWECWEHTSNSDFSDGCASGSTDCGSVCFYAECLECSDAYHEHCREDCHEDCSEECTEECTESCDADGNCEESCGESCSESCSETCVTVCWDERHGESPCVNWLWHLEGEPDDNYRAESFNSPNVGAALSFGALTNPGVIPPNSDCQTVGRATPESLDDIEPALVGATLESDLEWGHVDDVPVSLSDFPSLAVVPGEPGAPSLLSVVKVNDWVVTLNVSGYGANVLQYRHWFYNGLVPSEIRVPFRDLLGNVTVSQARGVHAFQVRVVYPDGTLSGASSVVYQVLGFENWIAGSAPALVPPVLSEPLIVVPDGVVRPSKPFISSLVQEPVVADSVRVTLYGNYSGVQYRWWPHSGQGPPVSSGYAVWKPVVLDLSYGFLAMQVEFLPLVSLNTVSIGSPSSGMPRYFNFQVRLVEHHIIDGEPVLVESEHSDVAIIEVWSGSNWEW